MSCVFCRIAARQAPATIVYEDEQAVAFRDIAPQAPVHILIVPREHISGPLDISEDREELIGHLVAVAAKVARQEGLAADGYRLVMNQGRNGGQSVFHLHMHLLGGRRMTWPPG
jgi:histidine triad (HIT) family protein